jgi:hypothetical protein
MHVHKSEHCNDFVKICFIIWKQLISVSRNTINYNLVLMPHSLCIARFCVTQFLIIVTYFEVCFTLASWPNLLHTYVICYYIPQTTIWHSMPRLFVSCHLLAGLNSLPTNCTLGNFGIQLDYSQSLSLVLRPTVSPSVCFGIKHPSGAYCDIFSNLSGFRLGCIYYFILYWRLSGIAQSV